MNWKHIDKTYYDLLMLEHYHLTHDTKVSDICGRAGDFVTLTDTRQKRTI